MLKKNLERPKRTQVRFEPNTLIRQSDILTIYAVRLTMKLELNYTYPRTGVVKCRLLLQKSFYEYCPKNLR